MTTILAATPQEIYKAWLDSRKHSAMTGGSKAEVDASIGGKYSTWDGYIFGVTLGLEPFKRIRQTWRTTDFPAGAPDSQLEVLLEETKEGTKLTLIHTQLPEDQVDEYRQGWENFYFKPMKVYFK